MNQSIVNTRSDLNSTYGSEHWKTIVTALNHERVDDPEALGRYGFADDAEFEDYAAERGLALIKPPAHEPAPVTLEQAKVARAEEILADYRALHSEGYDTGLGWSMAYYAADRAAYHQLLTLVRMLLEAEGIGPEALVALSDTEGLPHQVPAANVEGLLLDYGLSYQTLWERLPNARQALHDAESIEEVEAVSL